MKISCLISLMLLAVGQLAVAQKPIADDIDDITGSAEVLPLDWDPILTEFSVTTDAPHDTLFASATATNRPGGPDALVEKLQWLELKKLIAPRGPWDQGSPAYNENESVLCAWQRTLDADGRINYVTYGTGTEQADWDKKVGLPYCIYGETHQLRVRVGLDVLTNDLDPSERDKRLKRYFKVLQFEVTGVRLSTDCHDFRAALTPVAPGKAAPDGSDSKHVFTVFASGKDSEIIGADFYPESQIAAHGYLWDMGADATRRPGVYEFRVKARVLGGDPTTSKLEEKKVEGALRVVLVPDRQMQFDKLSQNRMRK